MFAGKPAAALAELDQTIEWSQRRGAQLAFGSFSLVRAVAHYQRGDLIEALADLASASNALSGVRGEYNRGLQAMEAFLALCLIERDDLAGAANALALPPDELPPPEQGTRISYLYALGRLQAAQGQLRGALHTLLECDPVANALGAANPAPTLSWRSEAAQVAALVGEKDRALELIGRELTLARAFGARARDCVAGRGAHRGGRLRP
jgi:hypothetical protein